MSSVSASPIIITLDGNIGAGKSTLLEYIRTYLPDVMIVQEPVNTWTSMIDKATGKNLLELFYEDKRRWAYTFQNCAILTRLRTLMEAVKVAKPGQIILTERSVLTDRFVFAEMLRDSGDLSSLEWDLYERWFNTFACDLPIRGIIHVTTGAETSAARILKRGRHGEEHIPLEYLQALDAQHRKWIASTDLPVLEITTEEGTDRDGAVEKIWEFLQGF